MKQFVVVLILICNTLLLNNFAVAQGQQRSNVEDFTITITFAQPPTTATIVQKAPLKYNKDFALVLQMDDGNPAIHDQVMPFFKGQNGNPGLFYTEGNPQNTQPFKMDASHYSFNGLGNDIHNYVNGFLHWDNIINLWAGEFGVINHGLTDPPQPDNALEVLRNSSYTKRKTASGTIPDGYDMNVYVIPNNVVAQIDEAKLHNLAVYHDGLNSIENPQRVESLPTIQGLQISRGSITNNLFQQVQAVANQSGPDNHYIATYFNHGFGGVDITFDQFKQQMNQIAAAYGNNGLNNIWSASSSEVFEYLRIKELVTIQKTIDGNVMTLTFSGNNIPTNFRYYAITLVVEGESNIVDMVVQQPENLSTYLYNQNKALLNLKWNGKVATDPVERATNQVVLSEQQPIASNALVGMDYVQMLADGDVKEGLRERLCALSGITYEPGFCRAPEFLGADTAICSGDSIQFTAPSAASYLWSTGSTAQSIKIRPLTPVEIWARATDNTGFVITDTVMVDVLEIPIMEITPNQAIIDPGAEVQLTASTTQSYLWSEGSTTQQITVSPSVNTLYWVEGTNAAGCTTRAEAIVTILYTTTVDFSYNLVCLGDTTVLIAQIETNDEVVTQEWDLNGDGQFDNGTADTIRLVINEAGERLIGLRIKTLSGAIHSAYNNVIIADHPVAVFDVNGNCFGAPSIFIDKSTVAIGSIEGWKWSTGDGSFFTDQALEYQYNNTGVFETELIVVSTHGCADTATSEITIRPEPTIDLRLDDGTIVSQNQVVTMPKGGQLIFKVLSAYDDIAWIGNVTTETFKVVSAGDFYVDIMYNGCTNRRNFSVIEAGGGGPPTNIVGILNLLTPNGDGYNDEWLIEDLDKISPARVAVYTRSGGLVYQSNDYKNDWNGYYNGNPLPEGSYYYVIEGSGGEVFKGPITILR